MRYEPKLLEELNEKYYIDGGVLRFKPRTNKSGKANAYNHRIVGSKGAEGWWTFNTKTKGTYKRSLAIFLMTHGYLPESVDHKDRDRLNDHPDNLVPSNALLQANNRGVRKDSSSGEIGIFRRPNGKYRAQIRRMGEKLDKTFDTLEEAKQARDDFIEKVISKKVTSKITALVIPPSQ